MASSQAAAPAFTFHYVGPSQTVALGIALPVACAIVTILRFLTRKGHKGGSSYDDWFILLGLINVVGMGISMVFGASMQAIGYPTPQPPPGLDQQQLEHFNPDSVVIANKVQWVFQIMMILSYGSIKASIILFYRRILVVTKGSRFDILTWVALFVVGLWTIAFELIMILDCGIHVSANWGDFIQQSTFCQVVGISSAYGMAVSDLILDLLVILMPLPLIWQLDLDVGQKFSVTGVLLLGASAIGASIARLIFYLQVLSATAKYIAVDIDLEITVLMYWSLLEAGLALIAACLPIIWAGRRVKKFRASIYGADSLQRPTTSDSTDDMEAQDVSDVGSENHDFVSDSDSEKTRHTVEIHIDKMSLPS